MQLWSATITLLLFILVNLSRVATQGIFPAGNFESLRRGNCSKCTERLHQDVAQLPRLTLIKQRILQALGRNPGREPQHAQIAPTLSPKAFIAPKQTKTTPEPVQRVTKGRQTSEVNEIITFPEAIGKDVYFQGRGGGPTETRFFLSSYFYREERGSNCFSEVSIYNYPPAKHNSNPYSAAYNLQQTTISNFAAFFKNNNKA